MSLNARSKPCALGNQNGKREQEMKRFQCTLLTPEYFYFRAREDLHLLLDGSAGTSYLYDKLVETGEAVSLETGKRV